MPKISVIIPVYNTQKYICRCLESIVNQSLKDIEIIIVNDASPDNSMDIVNEYALRDERIVIIDKKINEGLMCARKSGYTIAKGDYIVFCDSDDYYLPDAFDLLYKRIKETEADIVVSGYRYIKVNGDTYDRISVIPSGNKREDAFEALLRQHLPHNLWGCIFAKKMFTDYSYPCKKHLTNGEDFILFYRIIANITKIETLGIPTYAYCQNIGSATNVRMKSSTMKMIVENRIEWYKWIRSVYNNANTIDSAMIKDIYIKLIYGYDRSVLKSLIETIQPQLNKSRIKEELGFRKELLMRVMLNNTVIHKILTSNKYFKYMLSLI